MGGKRKVLAAEVKRRASFCSSEGPLRHQFIRIIVVPSFGHFFEPIHRPLCWHAVKCHNRHFLNPRRRSLDGFHDGDLLSRRCLNRPGVLVGHPTNHAENQKHRQDRVLRMRSQILARDASKIWPA